MWVDAVQACVLANPNTASQLGPVLDLCRSKLGDEPGVSNADWVTIYNACLGFGTRWDGCLDVNQARIVVCTSAQAAIPKAEAALAQARSGSNAWEATQGQINATNKSLGIPPLIDVNPWTSLINTAQQDLNTYETVSQGC